MSDQIVKDIPKPIEKTTSQNSPDARWQYARNFSAQFMGNFRNHDKEFAALPEKAQQVLTDVVEDSIKNDADQDPGRAHDLAIKANSVPNYPRGEAKIGWASNSLDYAKAIKKNEKAYTHEGKFDKKGFIYASAKELLELSTSQAKPEDISNFRNTLYLMTQAGVLDSEDIFKINGMTDGLITDWQIRCDIGLQRSGIITRDQLDTINQILERVRRFSYSQTVDGTNNRSVLYNLNDIEGLNAMAISHFKKIYNSVSPS